MYEDINDMHIFMEIDRFSLGNILNWVSNAALLSHMYILLVYDVCFWEDLGLPLGSSLYDTFNLKKKKKKKKIYYLLYNMYIQLKCSNED